MMALTLMLYALAGQEPVAVSQRVVPWSTNEQTRGCATGTEYADATSFVLAYDSYTRRGSLTLTNPRWRSIQEGRDYTFSLDLIPLASLQVKGTGRLFAGRSGFTIPFEGLDFITQVMEADQMNVSRGRSVVGRYSLSGSYSASLELARCNHRTLNRVRPDPFSEQGAVGNSKANVDPQLVHELSSAVEVLRPQLPLKQRTPHGEIRVTNIEARGGEIVYTMEVPSDLNEDTIAQLKSEACANSQMRQLMERGASYTYRIKDLGGEEFKTTVSRC